MHPQARKNWFKWKLSTSHDHHRYWSLLSFNKERIKLNKIKYFEDLLSDKIKQMMHQINNISLKYTFNQVKNKKLIRAIRKRQNKNVKKEKITWKGKNTIKYCCQKNRRNIRSYVKRAKSSVNNAFWHNL